MHLSVTYIRIVIISIYTNLCKFEWKEKTNLRKRKKKTQKKREKKDFEVDNSVQNSQDYFFLREELTDNACVNITDHFSFFKISSLFVPQASTVQSCTISRGIL